MWYLAYGSNLDPTRLRARLQRSLITADLAAAIPVRLAGYALCFDKVAQDGSGFATLRPQPYGDGRPDAEGLLWEVHPEAFQHLDNCEGVARGHYRRATWSLAVAGQPRVVEVYLHGANYERTGGRPRVDYLAHLLAGAGRLSEAYRTWLTAQPVHGDSA